MFSDFTSSEYIALISVISSSLLSLATIILSIINSRREYSFKKHELFVSQKLSCYRDFTSAFANLYANQPGTLPTINQFLSVASAVELVSNYDITVQVRGLITLLELNHYIINDDVFLAYKVCVSEMREDYMDSSKVLGLLKDKSNNKEEQPQK